MQSCQLQRNILKVKEIYISNLKKFYKHLKNLQIFSLNMPCALKSCSYCVQNYYNLKEIVPLEHMGSPDDVSEVPVTWMKPQRSCRMSCDVSEVTERLENELWRRWGDGRGWRRRLCSFSNPSVASPMSQIVLQPFCGFNYVTYTSPTSPGEPHMGQTSPRAKF